jgi:hypothetical protein
MVMKVFTAELAVGPQNLMVGVVQYQGHFKMHNFTKA